MSDDATALMDAYDEQDEQERRRGFIARMEHKLHAKEHRFNRSRR